MGRTHSIPAWAVMVATAGALLGLSWATRHFADWALAIYSRWMDMIEEAGL